ncbi:MAG TPA: sugar phosphate nucleotidyltransferase [Bryobacteraceae bacterium]|jgi:mannose-1-phosphate guanylyltransferase|nr:sugar phosphate nucleotidyltransferase [Bryobacteraceae bacterium]
MPTLLIQSQHASLAVSLPKADHLWGVLLAGGDGMRMQALTRRISGDSRPKQFCPIVGRKTLFEQTRARLEPLFARNRQVFVLSRDHERYYRGQLTEAGESLSLVQPVNRGTGTAMILALVNILERDADAMVAFFPCDHYYSCDDSFRATVRSAAAAGRQHPDSLVLVGAAANYPEAEYGWIEPEQDRFHSEAGPLFRVKQFWEKPPVHVARELLARGCLWNTFVIVGRAATFVELFRSQAPQTVTSLRQAIANVSLDSAYHLLPAVDFSRDVLTHVTPRLQVLRDRTSGWVDLGSPARVLATLMQNGIDADWLTEQDGSISNPGERTVVRQ